jgi:hypothetical protein
MNFLKRVLGAERGAAAAAPAKPSELSSAAAPRPLYAVRFKCVPAALCSGSCCMQVAREGCWTDGFERHPVSYAAVALVPNARPVCVALGFGARRVSASVVQRRCSRGTQRASIVTYAGFPHSPADGPSFSPRLIVPGERSEDEPVEAQLAQLWASYEAATDTASAQEALDAVMIAFTRVYEAWIPVEVDGTSLVRVSIRRRLPVFGTMIYDLCMWHAACAGAVKAVRTHKREQQEAQLGKLSRHRPSELLEMSTPCTPSPTATLSDPAPTDRWETTLVPTTLALNARHGPHASAGAKQDPQRSLWRDPAAAGRLLHRRCRALCALSAARKPSLQAHAPRLPLGPPAHAGCSASGGAAPRRRCLRRLYALPQLAQRATRLGAPTPFSDARRVSMAKETHCMAACVERVERETLKSFCLRRSYAHDVDFLLLPTPPPQPDGKDCDCDGCDYRAVDPDADPQVAVPFEGGMRLTHAITIMSRSEYNRHSLAAEGARYAVTRQTRLCLSFAANCIEDEHVKTRGIPVGCRTAPLRINARAYSREVDGGFSPC